MTVLALPREMNIDILSGDFISSRFFNWPQEESENEKIKAATKSFVEPLFSFLRERNCAIENQEEIEITDFLNNHVDIVNYLYEAPDVIREKFGNANLNLELVFDPEIEGHDGELFLNIETDLGIKEAREKLNAIDKEWLVPAVGKNIAKFNIDIEFV